MRLLVVTSYFGPETSVGVLRINAFVRHWTASGHRVTVMTMPFSGQLPPDLAASPLVSVHQVAPWFIGRKGSPVAQSYSKEAAGWKRRILRAHHWIRRNFLCNYLDPRTLWWPRVALAVRALLRAGETFDAVVSTVPSYTAHSAAAVIKRMTPAITWVADYRDLWHGNPIFPGCAPVRLIERTHERIVLRGADLIVSINEDLVGELRELHGGSHRYLVISNGIEDAEFEAARQSVGHPRAHGSSLDILYTGSVLRGYQDPTPLFEAVRDLSRELDLDADALTVTFIGDHAALQDLTIVRDPLVSKHLRLLGRVARTEALRRQREAAFLLFLGSQPVSSSFGSTRGVMTGKVFEYLVAGTEVLAVGVTADMRVAELLRKAGVGEAYGRDAGRIKDRLRRALSGEVARVAPDFEYIGQFRRSLQARALVEGIEAARRAHTP